MDMSVTEYAVCVCVALLGASLTALVLRGIIPRLRDLKIGQRILVDGPSWHLKKEGTPTMGGLGFFAVLLPLFGGAVILFYLLDGGDLPEDIGSAVIAALYAVACGVCGMIDDASKLRNRANKGLSAWQKYLMLLIFTVAFLLAMHRFGGLSTVLYIPFLNVSLQLGGWYWIFAALLLTGTVNAVNLTDGIDGLCGSVSAVVLLFIFALSLRIGATANAVLSCIGFGSCMGFLVFNLYPAQVFMGDTGSLFLGGLISGLAFALGSPMSLFWVGAVYMIEAASVILQVAVFKLTGKRIFKMAPFHHHLEKNGWSERRIVRVFTALTAVLAILYQVLSRH